MHCFSSQLPNDPRVDVKNEGTLLSITNLGLEHAGLYRCQTIKTMGPGSKPVSATFELLVECKFVWLKEIQILKCSILGQFIWLAIFMYLFKLSSSNQLLLCLRLLQWIQPYRLATPLSCGASQVKLEDPRVKLGGIWMVNQLNGTLTEIVGSLLVT